MKAASLVVACLAVAQCPQPQQDPLIGVGHTDASIDPRAGTEPLVDARDPASVLARARLLEAMHRALETTRRSDTVAPLPKHAWPVVLVDPGLASAQVRFVEAGEDAGDLRRAQPVQITSASLLLAPAPERVLDVQRQPMTLQGDDKARLVALVLARQALQAAGAEPQADLFAVAETVAGGTQFRVYAWPRTEGRGWEVRVAWDRKLRPQVEVHPLSEIRRTGDAVRIETLHPLAIARLLRSVSSQDVPLRIHTASGAFELDASGRLVHAAGT